MPLHSLARKFENCKDCSQYALVDQDGRCAICANRELELLQTAQRIMKETPKLSRDELAELLHVDSSRIEKWQRSGKVRCVILSTRCPQCGSPIEQFSCTACNYQATEEIRKNAKTKMDEKPKVREMHTRTSVRDRYRRNGRKNGNSRLSIVSG